MNEHELLEEAYDLLYNAFAIIANVSGGDWERQSYEWQVAADRFRTGWHNLLDKRNAPEDITALSEIVYKAIAYAQGEGALTLDEITPLARAAAKALYESGVRPNVGS